MVITFGVILTKIGPFRLKMRFGFDERMLLLQGENYDDIVTRVVVVRTTPVGPK